LQFEIHGYISPLPLPSISYSKPGRITQNGRGRCVPFGDNYKNTYAQTPTATHHFPSILRFCHRSLSVCTEVIPVNLSVKSKLESERS
jgi:hypothetical protein